MALPDGLRWFRAEEFRHPELVNADAARALDTARHQYGKPIILTSDARTIRENEKAGGVPNSLHLTGHAFDLKYPASAVDLFELVDAVRVAAVLHSFIVEIGLYPLMSPHVHVGFSRTGQHKLYVKP